MQWYQWMALFVTIYALFSLLYMTRKLLKLGKPSDFAEARGSIEEGVAYANTEAMSPKNKESAYLHLPTYLSGIFFHLGTFACIFVFLCSFLISAFAWDLPSFLYWIFAVFVSISALCGLGLFIKRLLSKKLNSFSSLDDYLSNGLTTLFQFGTALALFNQNFGICYYLIASLLLLYMPLGKLKHLVYYFSARYHLGVFYGSRGVWPNK